MKIDAVIVRLDDVEVKIEDVDVKTEGAVVKEQDTRMLFEDVKGRDRFLSVISSLFTANYVILIVSLLWWSYVHQKNAKVKVRMTCKP